MLREQRMDLLFQNSALVAQPRVLEKGEPDSRSQSLFAILHFTCIVPFGLQRSNLYASTAQSANLETQTAQAQPK